MQGLRLIDEDVGMTVLPPIYEFVQVPKHSEWIQQALVRYVRERTLKEMIRHGCRPNGEAFETVVCSLTTSLEPRVLDHLAHYCAKKDPRTVTD